MQRQWIEGTHSTDGGLGMKWGRFFLSLSVNIVRCERLQCCSSEHSWGKIFNIVNWLKTKSWIYAAGDGPLHYWTYCVINETSWSHLSKLKNSLHRVLKYIPYDHKWTQLNNHQNVTVKRPVVFSWAPVAVGKILFLGGAHFCKSVFRCTCSINQNTIIMRHTHYALSCSFYLASDIHITNYCKTRSS